MTIPDADLRAMVRSAVARHLRTDSGAAVQPQADSSGRHASHARLPLVAGGDGDGACLIEPAVRCNHCGYCQSYGH